MNAWLIKNRQQQEVDVEILEEAALFMAQATIQNALTGSGMTRAEFARRLNRPPSFVSRMLSGDHNLTIKTMARALAACGQEVRFGTAPLVWVWSRSENARVAEQPIDAKTIESAAKQLLAA